LKQIIILTIVSLFLSGGGIFIPAMHKLLASVIKICPAI